MAFGAKTVKGMGRGRVLVLEVICRSIAPGGHTSLASWCEGTSLPYHLGFDARDLESQALWEAIDGIGESEVEDARRAVAARMRGLFPEGLGSPKIEHANELCTIREPGHGDQVRDEARCFSERPRWHRTGDRVCVHVLLSQCAVALAEVLRRLLAESAGIKLTRRALLEGLAQIRDGLVIVDGRQQRVLEDLGEHERRLWDAVVALPGETLGVGGRRA